MRRSTGVNTQTRKSRPKTTGELVGTRLQPDLLTAIDSWRREQSDLPGRPESIRRILTDWLVEKGYLKQEASTP